MLEIYTDLEYARRHLATAVEPQDRIMVMSGIDRLLDQLIDIKPYLREPLTGAEDYQPTPDMHSMGG